jgi:hypothetical protein
MHLHTGLLAAALCTLDGIAGLAAAVIAIRVGLAAVKICQRFVLVAAPAQLDGYARRSIDDLHVATSALESQQPVWHALPL